MEDDIGDRQLVTETSIDGRKVNLILTSSLITWGPQNSVPLSDVLSTNRSTECYEGNPIEGLVLYYIHQSDNGLWTVRSQYFPIEGSDLLTSWIDNLSEKIVSAVGRPRRLLVYINPFSGKGQAHRLFEDVAEPLLKLAGVHTEVFVSSHSGYIEEQITKSKLSEVDGVVVVGGDGTLVEVTRGLIRRAAQETGSDLAEGPMLTTINTRVGVIPVGTGNINAKRAYGCRDITTATLHIIKGHTFPLDAFTVHDDSGLVTVGHITSSMGLYSCVTETSEANRWMGAFRFHWAFMKALYYMPKFDAIVRMTQHLPERNASTTNGVTQGDTTELRGTFLELPLFPFSKSKQEAEPGVLYIDVLRASGSRKDVFGHVTRMADGHPDMYKFDFVEHYETVSYSVQFTESSESHSSPTEGTQHRRISVDGDVYPLQGSEIKYRMHQGIIPMYGCRHVITDFKKD